MHAKAEVNRFSISATYPLLLGVFALLYYLSLRISLSLALVNEYITLFNVAAGIGLAILIRFGVRYWPAIFFAAYLTFYQVDSSYSLALFLAVGQTGQAVLGAWVLLRYCKLNNGLERIQDVIILMVVGAALVTLMHPVIAVIGMLANHVITSAEILFVWLNAWLGEIAGVMIFASVLLVWVDRVRWHYTSLRYAEACILFALFIFFGGVVFFGWFDTNIDGYSHYPVAYIFFPLLAWAAFRFGPRGATAATVVLACFALWSLVNNLGPFHRSSVYESHILTWLCMVTAAGLGMVLAADITQCIRTRLALIKSDERLSLAINGSQDGVWDWLNVKDDEIWWSPRVYQLLGYKQEELQSSHCSLLELMHPDDRARYLAMLEKHLNGDVNYNIEYRLQTKHLGYRWFHAKAQMVRSANSATKRLAGSLSDIHDRKHIQEDIAKLNKQLEERVLERTKDLSKINMELRCQIAERTKAEMHAMQLQEDLIRIGRFSTMGEMTTSFAHELHQPLMAIVNYSQASLLDLDNNADKRKNIQEYLQAISEQALRSGKIVKRLREFSKKGSNDKHIFNINYILQGIQPLLDMEAEQHAIVLNYFFDADDSFVKADEIQIQQVISNLVRNGMEAMEGKSDQTKSIVIKTSKDDDYVKVAVQDQGIGLKEADKSRVLESFYSTKTYGVGIGLSISNTIAKAHGGSIKIFNNESGIGATAELVLPRTGIYD